MSRSTKRNLDGARSQRSSVGNRSCPRGRARCGVCSGTGRHDPRPELAARADEREAGLDPFPDGWLESEERECFILGSKRMAGAGPQDRR